MKQSDFTFKEKVKFSEMVEMAGKLVESLYNDPDKRLTMTLGSEYLFLQAAVRLFTTYGTLDSDDKIEEFMDMVFAVGVERFEDWLRDNAGAEKYKAFERMVKRGVERFLNMGPLEMFVDEAGKALHHLNQMINESGEITPETAIVLLRQLVAEQEEPPLE